LVAGGCAQINKVTDTTGFMPHGYCLRWEPALVFSMVASNLGIALAYFAIPGAIWYLTRHKKDLPYPWMFRLFAMFIIACGLSHVMKVWTLYEPFYWTEVLIDVFTAGLSLLTAAMLWPLIPKALSLKSAQEFEAVATKAKQTLKALQESEENIGLLVSHVVDYAIFMLDENGIVKTWNEGAQRIYGYTAEEITGKHFSCFYRDEDEAKEALNIAFNFGRYEAERTRIRKDGVEFLANIVITPLYDDTRELKGFAKITRDITERKKAEDRFKKLLESAPDAMVIVDQQGKMVLVNSQTEKIFSYPKEEIMGQFIELLIPQWTPAIYGAGAQKVFAESYMPSTDERIQLTALRKDGTEFPVEISLSPIETDHGTLLSSAIRDVSDRKQVEQSKAQLAAIVESSHDAIYSIDLKGMIRTWNESAEKMFGYSKEEAIGRPNAIIVPTDCLKQEKTIINMVMAGGKAEHFETVRLTKHGNLIPISITVSGIKDEFGKIIGVSKISRDIKEQKRINDLLQSQAELLDLTHDTVIVRDLDGTIRYWNHGAQEMYGFTREEAVGRISHDLLKTEFPKPLADWEQELLDKGRYDCELIHFTKDGKSVIVSSRQTVKTDANGAPCAILEINNDITEQKKAQLQLLAIAEELKNSNAELEQFASVASHDLQEPLRGVSGCLELLEEKYKGKFDEQADALISHAINGASRMHTLIRDLLTLSRINTRGKTIQSFDLTTALEQALENLGAAIKDSQAIITHDNLPVIEGDHAQIARLFQNLIANAVKFSADRSPRINIKAERQNEHWLFAVCDNGIGFKREYSDIIFLPFKRLHSRDKYPGTGIGLAICKKIVERHGGNIWAESELGKGAIFYFSIPINTR